MVATQLIQKNLFEKILVEPAKRGNNELFVLTGYASAAMVTKHFEVITKELSLELSIDLHIGMTGRDGLSRNTLLGLQSIPRQIPGRVFNCTMNVRGTSNHSKLYVWCDDSGPQEAYIGSSNYTQLGFGVSNASTHHKESCVQLDANVAFEYVLASSQGGISYKSPDILDYIDLIDELAKSEAALEELNLNSLAALEFVDLPLVMTRPSDNGEVHSKSGLNWGQREGRNPNQAYIPVPSFIAKSSFFPEKGIHFQVITDDGEAFICTIAQDGDKALETPNDNSILGKYFRKRLGLALGTFVTKEHLESFGSNQVRIFKEDDESFRLTFEPGQIYEQTKS